MVLVVDDNEDTANYLVRMLTILGFKSSGVHDGQAAIDSIQHDKPSLIILDLMMPGMSGKELLTHLRHRFSPAELPAIIYSADWSAVEDAELHQLGIADFISKGSGEFDRLVPLIKQLATTRPIN